MRRAAKSVVYIATVVRTDTLADSDGLIDSSGPNGQWSSFIGTSLSQVVGKAMAMVDRWGRDTYVVTISHASSIVRPRRDYTLETL